MSVIRDSFFFSTLPKFWRYNSFMSRWSNIKKIQVLPNIGSVGLVETLYFFLRPYRLDFISSYWATHSKYQDAHWHFLQAGQVPTSGTIWPQDWNVQKYSQTSLIRPHWSQRYFGRIRNSRISQKSLYFNRGRFVPSHFWPDYHLGGSKRGGLGGSDCNCLKVYFALSKLSTYFIDIFNCYMVGVWLSAVKNTIDSIKLFWSFPLCYSQYTCTLKTLKRK